MSPVESSRWAAMSLGDRGKGVKPHVHSDDHSDTCTCLVWVGEVGFLSFKTFSQCAIDGYKE